MNHGPDCDCAPCRDFRSGMDWARSIMPSYQRDDLARWHTDDSGDAPQAD